MRKLPAVLIVICVVFALMALTSGNFLVVNNPQHADVIVVLAGETDRRPALGIQLVSQNYAPRMLLDVPADCKGYGRSTLDLAQQFIKNLPQPQRASICPIYGLSTKTEAQDVKGCLSRVTIRSILVVTSDYHTRRALSTFRHELPGFEVSVAGAGDPQQFGASWWKHRQWAKFNFDEWLKLVWWEAIDRWR